MQDRNEGEEYEIYKRKRGEMVKENEKDVERLRRVFGGKQENVMERS